MKLDSSFLHNRKKVVDEVESFNSILEDRITYIVKCICKAFNHKFYGWDYPSTHEDVIATFDDSVCSDYVNIFIYCKYKMKQQNLIIIRNGENWNLYKIPLVWLTTDFEEELIQGQKMYLKKVEEKKNKDKQLLDQIKSKLSPEEIRVLKDSLK